MTTTGGNNKPILRKKVDVDADAQKIPEAVTA
jgi:hypothetical protein